MINQDKIEIIKKEIADSLAIESSAERIMVFFSEMFTESEMSNIIMRWELMKKLLNGQSQRHIAEDLSLSLCKITRGSKILKNSDSVVRSYLDLLATNDKPQSSGDSPALDSSGVSEVS